MGLRPRLITHVDTGSSGKVAIVTTADGTRHRFNAAVALAHGYVVGRILPTPAYMEGVL